MASPLIDLAPQVAAAVEALDVFRTIDRRACLIGGLALQRWGQPRFTADVDLTVPPALTLAASTPLPCCVLARGWRQYRPGGPWRYGSRLP